MPLRSWIPLLLLGCLVSGARAARGEAGGPFQDDLGYPWGSALPYGASGLYHLTAPRAALEYRRAEASDIRRSSVSKTTADGKRDALAASGYAPVTNGLVLGGEGFVRQGRTVVTFTAPGVEDLTYRYARNVRSFALVAAYELLPGWAAGARYGSFHVEDFGDTTELGPFGEKTSDKQSFRVFAPSLSWHGEQSEVTLQHEPKVNRAEGDSLVRAPAVASVWYLYKPRAPTTLMAGFAYDWYGALGDGEENAPEFALGQRRWMEYGDVGLVLRYAAKHYASKVDVQPDNVERTTIEFVSHAQIAFGMELQMRVGYGIGSGKGETEARRISVDTEELDGLLSVERKL